VAFDIQAMLENARFMVDTVEPQSDGPGEYDLMIVDSAYASHAAVNRMFAAGVTLIGYTGDVQAIEDRFPGCVVISKPSPQQVLLMAVQHALSPQPLPRW
jgi:hypothetical protein